MVVFARGDLEGNGDDVEKGRGGVLSAEVVADMEEKLGGARDGVGVGEEGLGAAAVGVCRARGNGFAVLEEFDENTGGWVTVGGVEDVSGEFAGH